MWRFLAAPAFLVLALAGDECERPHQARILLQRAAAEHLAPRPEDKELASSGLSRTSQFNSKSNHGVVRIHQFVGRLGNHILQIANALVFAEWIGATRLAFPTSVPGDISRNESVFEIIDLPEHLTLSQASVQDLSTQCQTTFQKFQAGEELDFFNDACSYLPARLLHDALVRHILPLMHTDMHECAAEALEDDLLVVHLRSGDMMDMTWPCNVIERIQESFSCKKVLAVTTHLGDDRRHWCVDRINKSEHGVRFQSATVRQDFCSLMRAKSLFLGHSSFTEAAALLNVNLKHVYQAGCSYGTPFQNISRQTLWCSDESPGRVWPGTKVTLAMSPGFTPTVLWYNETARTWTRGWFTPWGYSAFLQVPDAIYHPTDVDGITFNSDCQLSVGYGSHLHESISYAESLGFFNEDDELWKRRKELHHAWMKKQRNSSSDFVSLFNETSGRTFWQWHYEPSFHCELAERIGNVGDGGKWVCNPDQIRQSVKNGGSCLVYSVVSNGQFDFEDGVIKEISPSCEIHIFDPAPPASEAEQYTAERKTPMPAQATYHQVAIGPDGTNAVDGVPTKSISTIIKELGHTGRWIDIFKIDCEGCEWSAYSDFSRDGVMIRQIQAELHLTEETWPSPVLSQWVRPLFETLSEAGFVVFNKEPNILASGNDVEYAFLRLNTSF